MQTDFVHELWVWQADWLLDIGTLVQCTKGLSGASRVTDRTVSSAPVSEDPRLTPSGCHCNTTTGTFEGLHWNQCVWSDHPDQASPLWLEFQMTVVLHPWIPGTAEHICSGPGDMLVGPSSSGRQWCSLLRAGSPCIEMTVSNVLGGVGVCAMLCQHGPNTEAEPHRASLEWCVYAHTTMWPLGSPSCCGRRMEQHSANNIQHQVRSVSQRWSFLFFLFIYIYFLICFLQYHKSSHFRYTINFIINKNCILWIQALAPLTSSACLCFPLLLTLVAFSLLSHYVLQVVHTQLAPFDP